MEGGRGRRDRDGMREGRKDKRRLYKFPKGKYTTHAHTHVRTHAGRHTHMHVYQG